MPGPGVTNDSPALAKHGCKSPLPLGAWACWAALQWGQRGGSGGPHTRSPVSPQGPSRDPGRPGDGRVAEERLLKCFHLQLWLAQLRLAPIYWPLTPEAGIYGTLATCPAPCSGLRSIFFDPPNNAACRSCHGRPCFTDEDLDGGLARSQSSSKVTGLISIKAALGQTSQTLKSGLFLAMSCVCGSRLGTPPGSKVWSPFSSVYDFVLWGPGIPGERS